MTMATATKANTMIEPMLGEFREEAAVTKRILERVPADKLTWRPHSKSMTLGQLAIHIATVPGALATLAQGDGLDVTQANFTPPQPKTTQEIRDAFEQSVIASEKVLNEMTDEAAQGSWTLKRGDKELFTQPRI